MKKKQNDQIEELQKQIDEWKAKYLRALADYQNLERRNKEEWQEKQKYTTIAVVSKILPMLDTFRKAADHIQNPGLDLGIKSFTDTLADLGIEKFNVVGLPFDPAMMECIDVADGEENIVLDELSPGYIYKGILLRPAKVKVGRTQNPAESHTEETRNQNSE